MLSGHRPGYLTDTSCIPITSRQAYHPHPRRYNPAASEPGCSFDIYRYRVTRLSIGVIRFNPKTSGHTVKHTHRADRRVQWLLSAGAPTIEISALYEYGMREIDPLWFP